MFRLCSFVFNHLKPRPVQVRYLYGVHHNPNRGVFYVKLKDNAKAVLRYKTDGKVLDMFAVNVPPNFSGQGLGRLLAETAFTYAIVHDYYMVLTCPYLQKYYLATKTEDLAERVVGPEHLLDGPDAESLDVGLVDDLPDPEDDIISAPPRGEI